MSKTTEIRKFHLLLNLLIVMVSFNTTYGQDASVVTFKHTIRWLEESNFPNYFLNPEVRDSINTQIKADLIHQFRFSNINFPEKIDYRNIKGFGKPKEDLAGPSSPNGYNVHIFSFLTRETTGYGLIWSIKTLIRKEGKIILEKEVKHNIIYSNDIPASQQQFSSRDFQRIFIGLIRETISMESEYTGAMTIAIGPNREEQEKEIRLWFPKSIRYVLKTNGAWPSLDNSSSLLVSDKDTVMKFNYKNKLDVATDQISLKPMLAKMFTDATGVGMDYTVKEKGRKRGVIQLPGGKRLLIHMKWTEEKTSATNSDEVQSRIISPLEVQLFNDSTSVGGFSYQRISKALPSDRPNEKFNLTSGSFIESSSGTGVIHRVVGILNNIPFTAEFNAITGLIELNSDSHTLTTMLFYNCNPESNRSLKKINTSATTGAGSEEDTKAGNPSSKKEAKLKWYPYYMKEGASSAEVVTSLEILICLFFGVENM